MAQAALRRHPLDAQLHYLRATLLLALDRVRGGGGTRPSAPCTSTPPSPSPISSWARILRKRGARPGALRAFRNARDLCAARPSDEELPAGAGERVGALHSAASAEMETAGGERCLTAAARCWRRGPGSLARVPDAPPRGGRGPRAGGVRARRRALRHREPLRARGRAADPLHARARHAGRSSSASRTCAARSWPSSTCVSSWAWWRRASPTSAGSSCWASIGASSACSPTRRARS